MCAVQGVEEGLCLLSASDAGGIVLDQAVQHCQRHWIVIGFDLQRTTKYSSFTYAADLQATSCA